MAPYLMVLSCVCLIFSLEIHSGLPRLLVSFDFAVSFIALLYVRMMTVNDV